MDRFRPFSTGWHSANNAQCMVCSIHLTVGFRGRWTEALSFDLSFSERRALLSSSSSKQLYLRPPGPIRRRRNSQDQRNSSHKKQRSLPAFFDIIQKLSAFYLRFSCTDFPENQIHVRTQPTPPEGAPTWGSSRSVLSTPLRRRSLTLPQ